MPEVELIMKGSFFAKFEEEEYEKIKDDEEAIMFEALRQMNENMRNSSLRNQLNYSLKEVNE